LQVTAFSSNNIAAQIAQNSSQGINQATAHYIGREMSGAFYLDGYLAEINFIDGQALTPSSFGSTNSTTGVWQPAKYTGTYGTNGFYLPFTNITSTTTLGYDSSGNGNNWTTNNISLTAGATYDSMTDVPTLTSATAANYCVLNPLDKTANSYATLANANLQATGNTSTDSGAFGGTIFVSTGLWYWESSRVGTGSFGYVGAANIGISTKANAENIGISYRSDGATKGFGTAGPTLTTWDTVGDIIMIALDMNNGAVYVGKNGTWLNSGVPTSGASRTGALFTWTAGTYTLSPAGGGYQSGNGINLNCGQQAFSYTPPTGFVALNTYNLPASTIPNGAAYMAATLYTGNGTTTGNTQTIANTVGSASFQPDLVWIKSRSAATWNILTDSVRGANKTIYSNSTFYEESLSNVMNSFNSNGFTAAYNSSYAQVVANANGETYVGWQWKGGGTGVSNTSGTITSTVSANTTSGCSVVKYISNGTNGATVGHGLGVAPSLVIVKCTYTGTSQAWAVYHASLGATQYLTLQSTDAATTSSAYWNNTAPSSSVFTIGTSNDVNINSSVYTYAAYCFAAIKGFSAFGGYTGNGSTDGPFIYTGFRPRYVMIKRTDGGSESWFVLDTARSPYNVPTAWLAPNLSNAEGTDIFFDILSNGFKFRATISNGSGQTFIYAAFAESPFQNSLAR
jgi:hypothetical protein